MEISIQVSKGSKNYAKEYAQLIQDAEYTTNRMDSPGKFTFTLIENNGIAIDMGACVRVVLNETKFFKGYVFSAERSKDRKVKYVAYDQLRYLKAKASYTFVAMSLSDIIKQIAKDFKLSVGSLADTGYKIPSIIADNQSCLDIIFDALSKTIVETGKIFIFYDDYGKLTLKEAKQLKWNRLIGEKSLLSDYQYKMSIDQSYNRIKLARPNKETGRADTYVHDDSDHIKQWGLLQYYDTVDENMNSAQIDEMCKNYLKYYNRVWQSMTMKNIIGHPKIKAGWIIPVMISQVDATNVQRFFLTEKVTHKLKGNTHTMDIEVKNFNDLGVS